jgi:DNA-binding NarL/FixJ family response regulator
MLTGYATVELAVAALTEYNTFSCLEKSAFNRAEFRTLVQKALASKPPIHTEPDVEETADIQQSPAINAFEIDGQPKILVVEDDAGWRNILSEILVEANMRVQICSGYGEALGHLQRTSFNLAIVDLYLDGAVSDPASIWLTHRQTTNLDGYQLISTFHDLRIPAIVVSGVGIPERIVQTFAEYGIFSFISKQNFNRQIFLDTVHSALVANQIPDILQSLTERELEVLELLAQGATNKVIAAHLYISANTVKRHLKSIFSKLGVHTRSAAAAKAVQARQK